MKPFRTAFAALVVCVIVLVGVGVVWEAMVWRHGGYANMPWKELSPGNLISRPAFIRHPDFVSRSMSGIRSRL